MAKPKQASSFRCTVYCGTPNHQEDNTYSDPRLAKNWLLGRLDGHAKWAECYAHDTLEQLAAIRTEIDGLNLRALHRGEERVWSATDVVSKVEFVFRVIVEER